MQRSGIDSPAVSEAASTKADDVALELEQAIVSGELAPGTVLRQDRLSEQYGVSRTPIREALRRLAALGLVSFEPNRGVRVRTLSRAELREAFLIRAELESLATEIAAERMTRADLDELEAIEDRFAGLTEELRRGGRLATDRRADLVTEWVRANHAFHDVIYRLPPCRWSSGSPRAPATPVPPSGRRPTQASSTSSTARTSGSTGRYSTRWQQAARAAPGHSRASMCSPPAPCSNGS
jgi:DNA-binding GntR family transcriptional regulator